MNQSRIFLSFFLGAATACFAQPNRILSKIDNNQKVILSGHIHAGVNANNDAGAVAASFRLPYMTLMLKPTDTQQTGLNQLLLDQQNPASGSFRQWLTPEQYADRFGVSAADTAQIVDWLQSQGFTVNPVSRSRTFITFSGTAGQVQSAFGTAIHQYRVSGETHFANATDPAIPAALAPMVSGIRGLTDFKLKSHAKVRPRWSNPPSGTAYALAPDDFATIYDISSLYTSNLNGSGITIVIPGQTELYNRGTDTTSFWTKYGSSAKLVQTQVPGYPPSPLISPYGDLDESNLDTQWSGAVARGATIQFVYSGDAWSSAMYAVDNKLGQVMSVSYGMCEQAEGITLLPGFRQTVQMANAFGMTVTAAAGDAGAVDCDDYGDPVAEGGLAIDEPGSIPEVTSMGGTQLSTGSAYWNTSNTSTNESAKAYRGGEESAWNDNEANISGGGGFLSGGGGASVFFPQPAWQNGIVPNDGWRHVPDVSFNSSTYIVPYVINCGSAADCFEEQGGIEFLGGTSAAAPTMAGVVAILNQSLNAQGVGNINPMLYALAQSSSASSVFHDITAGNTNGPCATAMPGCGSNGQVGWSAATGYDNATGIGSLDVANFIHSWGSVAPTSTVVVPSIDQNPVFQGNSETCGNLNQWNFQLTLTEEAGIGATVTGFTINGASQNSLINSIFGTGTIAARQSISGCYSLTGLSAPASETFGFSGVDANGHLWTTAITIPFQAALAPLSISGITNGASFTQTYAPGMILSVFGAGLGTYAIPASTIPLPEYMAGVTAIICAPNCNNPTGYYYLPLYYVGPTQVNLQIPFEVTGRAQLMITTPYNSNGVIYNFNVAATAPGIFMLEDGTSRVANGVSPSGSVGQAFTIYMTGQGAVSPAMDDGYSPTADGLTQTPKPRAAVSVTVGGIAASTTDGNWFVGIPGWSVGVTQINFTIPAGVPSGTQPVVVTVGGVASAPAYMTIQ